LKVTLDWLKEFVHFDLNADQLVHALTMVGLEVEECSTLALDFSQVKIGKIVDFEKKSKADSLTVCQVDSGDKTYSVVCGAPNVKKGLLTPIALPGAVLAKGNVVGVKNVHGILSEGILLSEAELGLTDRADTIMELPAHAPVGADLGRYLGDPLVVLDVFITPNRSDCLSVQGLAREIAAMSGSIMQKHPVHIQEKDGPGPDPVYVDIRDIEKCARYSGRLIQNIQISPSPFWMARRLYAVGIRAISNVVDITNYIMWETGQPLHAFDYRLLEGGRILVRCAEPDETFTTLDGKEHKLDDDALLICDSKKPVALAGIMGGLNSEVQPDTEIVFLESAHFDAINIRKTAKKLAIQTESSRRFERGVDPNSTVYAMNRAAQLMTETAHGQIVNQAVDNYARKIFPVEIEISQDHVNSLLGTFLTTEHIEKILNSIELKTLTRSEGHLQVQVPTFRPDLVKEVDLIEDVAIHHGYDNIPDHIETKINQLQISNERVSFKEQVRNVLAGIGLKEILSFNLIAEKHAQLFVPDGCSLIKLLNPISADLAVLRPSLIPSLMTAIAYNKNRQLADLAFFEVGNVAWDKDGFIEQTHVAGMITGDRMPQSWYGQAQSVDFYDIKAVMANLLSKLGIHGFDLRQNAQGYWDHTAVSVYLGEKLAGVCGKIDSEICTQFKIKTPDIYAFYLDFDSLFENRRQKIVYEQISRFPSVPFDLALLVDYELPIGKLEQTIRSVSGSQLTDLRLFDYYTGEQIQKGKKSIAFSLTFSSKERTLSEEEVNTIIQAILVQLANLYGAELRPK
jgi:phenylalanyl-tRNA synthetase beta chain